jgi:hypothetical protein
MICLDDEVEINYDNSTFDDDDLHTFGEADEDGAASGDGSSSRDKEAEQRGEPILDTFSAFIVNDFVTGANIRGLVKQKLQELQLVFNDAERFRAFLVMSANCGCGQPFLESFL